MIIKQLTKHYGAKRVVDEVSFEIPKGKVLSLIGPNGCLLYTSPSPRDGATSRMPSSA